RAKEVAALKERIRAAADGSAEEDQAMVSLLEAAGLADIVSDKSASAGLLAQIKYGDKIKADIEGIKATDGKAKIEADAARQRETSNARWASATAGIEASMTRIGDAIRPITDLAADGLTKLTYGIAGLAERSPEAIRGALVLGGAVTAAGAAFSAFKIAKGVLNLTRGTLMGNPNVVQRVFVTNSPAAGGSGRASATARRGGGMS